MVNRDNIKNGREKVKKKKNYKLCCKFKYDLWMCYCDRESKSQNHRIQLWVYAKIQNTPLSREAWSRNKGVVLLLYKVLMRQLECSELWSLIQPQQQHTMVFLDWHPWSQENRPCPLWSSKKVGWYTGTLQGTCAAHILTISFCLDISEFDSLELNISCNKPVKPKAQFLFKKLKNKHG